MDAKITDKRNAEQLFDVVSTGKIAKGYKFEDVENAVASIFKIDASVASDIVNSNGRVIKRNISRKNAERFFDAFMRAGLIVKLEPSLRDSQQEKSSDGEIQRHSQSDNNSLVVFKNAENKVVTSKQNRSVSFLSGVFSGLVVGVVIGYLVFGPWRIPVFGFTDAEKNQITALENEIIKISDEIKSDEDERAKVAGGLVAVIIDARLEIHRGTKALLEQRLRAIKAGISINQSAPGIQPDLERADQIAEKIRVQKSKVERARLESERAGGLVGALRHATLATEEQTLAMMHLAEVSARYGLPGFQASSVNIETGVKNQSNLNLSDLPDLPEYDGPFGLAMGVPLDELEATAIPNAPGKYIISRVPRPHPYFQSYVAQVGKNSGLCWIKAIGRDIDADSYGISVKSAYNEIREKLAKIYGRSYEEMDILLPGSIWDEPREWMMAMKQGERQLMSMWRSSSKDLQNNLSSVAVAAVAKSTSSAYIAVEYQFKNEHLCDSEINAVVDDVF